MVSWWITVKGSGSMNTKRLIVLGVAGVMAIVAALLARNLLGGGTPNVQASVAAQMPMSDVLVASTSLQPGQALTADAVRWQKWPSSSVDSTFITRASITSINDAVKGTVVRSPIISGQPITNTAIVHADAAGFMAAMLTPGMRAISIPINADSGAGGFILPNDRVDLILTRKVSGDSSHIVSSIILKNVRVLAVDQTFKQEKDTKTVVGKTATLELGPVQAELVARAVEQGSISLALRPLTDSDAALASNGPVTGSTGEGGDQISIIRYGIARESSAAPQGGKTQ
jgi:pilus assembly protein CpaB